MKADEIKFIAWIVNEVCQMESFQNIMAFPNTMTIINICSSVSGNLGFMIMLCLMQGDRNFYNVNMS